MKKYGRDDFLPHRFFWTDVAGFARLVGRMRPSLRGSYTSP